MRHAAATRSWSPSVRVCCSGQLHFGSIYTLFGPFAQIFVSSVSKDFLDVYDLYFQIDFFHFFMPLSGRFSTGQFQVLQHERG